MWITFPSHAHFCALEMDDPGARAAIPSATSNSATPGDALSNAVLNGDAERACLWARTALTHDFSAPNSVSPPHTAGVGRLIMSGVPVDSIDSVRKPTLSPHFF